MAFLDYYFSALLAAAGGALSFYFYLVYSKKIKTQQFWVPKICQLEKSECVSIIDSKYGKIFGFSNALLGSFFLVFYSLVLIAVPLGYIGKNIPFYASVLTIVIAIYLIYGLIRLGAVCVICLTVHSFNFIIFLLQLINLL